MAVTRNGPYLQLLNNWIDELDGAITDAATSITVADGSALPTDGYYIVRIDSEDILIGSRSGNVLTVLERGADGTTAAAHSDAAEVRASLSAVGFRNYLVAGQAPVFHEDGSNETAAAPLNRILSEDNAVLTSSDFTWLNQGTATATDKNGKITLSLPGDTSSPFHQIRGLYVANSLVEPYNIKCKVSVLGSADHDGATVFGCHFGLLMRDSATGEIITMSARHGEHAWLCAWDDVNTYHSFSDDDTDGTSVPYRRMYTRYEGSEIWLRIRVVSGEVQGYISYDGVNWSRDDNYSWQEAYSTLTSTGNAPDQWGFYASNVDGEAGAIYTFEAFTIEEE